MASDFWGGPSAPEKPQAMHDAQLPPVAPLVHPYFNARVWGKRCCVCQRQCQSADDAAADVCLACAWTVCAVCKAAKDADADADAYHAQACLARSADRTRVELEHALGSAEDEDVAILLVAELTRRIAVHFRPKDHTRLEWDLLRLRGIDPPTPEQLKVMMAQMPGINTRGSGMAELALVAMLFRADKDPEASMQAVLQLHGSYALIHNLRFFCLSLTKEKASAGIPASAAAGCYVASSQVTDDQHGYRSVHQAGQLPSAIMARDLDSGVANVYYLVSLLDLSTDENSLVMRQGDPELDPARDTWSPAIRSERRKQWQLRLAQRPILTSHQLLLRLVVTPARVHAMVAQSHSILYSMGDWFAGRVTCPQECAEFTQPLEDRARVESLGALLDQLADPKVEDAARRFLYARLTGVDLARPVAPLRLVTTRMNMNA